MVTTTGIAEVLDRAGRKMIALSAGSTGSAFLMAPKAHRGTGTVINGDFFPEKVAYPDTTSEVVLQRFGPQPKKGGATDRYDAAVDWAMEVLRESYWPSYDPRSFHVDDRRRPTFHAGPRRPEALAAIRNDDRQLGLTLQKLEALGLRGQDERHCGLRSRVRTNRVQRQCQQALSDAKLLLPIRTKSSWLRVGKRSRSTSGIAIRTYSSLWSFCSSNPGVNRVHAGAAECALRGRCRRYLCARVFPFRRARTQPGYRVHIPLVIGAQPARRSRGLITTDERNEQDGPVDTATSGHGGIGPWTRAHTMLAWGPDFKRATVIRTPSANVE